MSKIPAGVTFIVPSAFSKKNDQEQNGILGVEVSVHKDKRSREAQAVKSGDPYAYTGILDDDAMFSLPTEAAYNHPARLFPGNFLYRQQ